MTIATRANQLQSVQRSHAFYPLNMGIKGFQSVWKVSHPYLCIARIAVLLVGSLLFVHLHSMLKRSRPSQSQQNASRS